MVHLGELHFPCCGLPASCTLTSINRNHEIYFFLNDSLTAFSGHVEPGKRGKERLA